jgi:microcystin-dependent protein
MPTPFIGELRLVPWNFAQNNWAFCDGQTLLISQNNALFSVLGTTYGGDGLTTFKLPDLRGRVPIHASPSYPVGTAGGEETHTLTALEMQTHSHTVNAAPTAGLAASTGHVWGISGLSAYHGTSDSAMNPLSVVDATGGGQPHDNIQPYLTLNYVIALQGVVPSATSTDPAFDAPLVAEIRMVAFGFAPFGWAKCDGQLLNISSNTALFSLLGTYYGGDGKTTFSLPPLQGASTMHPGTGPGLSDRFLGEASGEATVSVTAAQTPAHTHQLRAVSSAATKTSPVGNAWASSTVRPYSSQAATATMGAAAIGSAGGGQPHNNMQPYLPILFVIALTGVFPQRQ